MWVVIIPIYRQKMDSKKLRLDLVCQEMKTQPMSVNSGCVNHYPVVLWYMAGLNMLYLEILEFCSHFRC